MFSFQAIHNRTLQQLLKQALFIDYVNVLFSSNSQHSHVGFEVMAGCLSIMSMFSFRVFGGF